MPKSLTLKISLSFILIIFAEGHIYVPSNGAEFGHVKPVSVCWF